jgi:anti-anti-sigma factor
VNVPMQSILLRRHDQDVHVVELRGMIDDESRQTLITVVRQAMQQDTKRLIIDFQNMVSINCSGICALVETIVQVSRKKIVLDGTNVRADILAILKLTGMDQYFTTIEEEKPPFQEDTGIKAFSEANWASTRGPLEVEGDIPEGLINLNVNGRQLMGPLEGFGQLWQKTYSMEMDTHDITPAGLIADWKTNFGRFWPPGNHIFIPGNQISLGKVGLLNLSMGPGLKLVTGMVVMYEDDSSFAFLTPQGHMYAGWISFSAYYREDKIMTQIRALIRAGDPVYELGFRLGFGHTVEDRFWKKTLQNLASHFGSKGTVQQHNLLIDPGIHWKGFKNLWYNAAIRTTFYIFLTPFRWLIRLLPGLHEREKQ